MKSLVSAIAIKSWHELIYKVPLFGVFIGTMIMTLETLLMPPEDIQTFWELFPMIIAGTSVLSCVFFPIVTHQYRLQIELSQMALTDHLTGLPNRRAFLTSVSDQLTAGVAGYLLLVDVDHFKQINDTYGHGIGDQCLITIASQLRSIVGPQCTYGRIGGEEFAIFTADVSERGRDDMASQLTQPLHLTVENLGKPLNLTLTMSVGASRAAGAEKIETLLRQADIALYTAKDTGRARMVDWVPEMDRAS